jgi:hypothetical protein
VARAIVSGALANKPRNGGEAWVRLAWVLGLRRLGFETYFVEQIDAADCVGEDGGPAEFAASVNRSYFESVVADFDLADRAGLLLDGGCEAAGLGLEEIAAAAAGADLLVNVSGHLSVEEILAGPQASVYLDLDPGFTQAWHEDRGVPFRIPRHDHYATVGLNIGSPACPVPGCGLDWVPTPPPVVLEHWPRRPPPAGPIRFTTVATWRSPFGGLEIGGREMDLKHHQFRRLIDLPERVPEAEFEIALDIHPGDSADLERLLDSGWTVSDPRRASAGPREFRDYVGASSAEFSVAQGVYVGTASGWFSDRTAAYLASGRPAVVQDTGVAAMRIGEGLLSFSSLEGAVEGCERIVAEPAANADAARQFAEAHLDSDLVIGQLLSRLGIGG